ncbi:GDP-mannose 4,6-dehydratase [Serratia fonticola]|uniref:GDP-mannose 4,6-dehydratase n=1 Tax=Serratia fonticola TaxID=47917 RepID=UPI00217B8F97|nr:GDP-mannose 4,6-dehydratase [Serratia fonticola]CAI1954162.1 dTDP-glucose 4,6-dehydratase 2 [Serratia fonticola]
MKIIITGGAGFIGSGAVRDLINDTNSRTLIVGDRTYVANAESFAQIASSERFKFEHVDICERQELERVFAAGKSVKTMHLATESFVDCSNDVDINTLPEASRQSWQSPGDTAEKTFRFNLISTDEVYDKLHGTDERFTVTMYAPSSLYSASKSSSDLRV